MSFPLVIIITMMILKERSVEWNARAGDVQSLFALGILPVTMKGISNLCNSHLSGGNENPWTYYASTNTVVRMADIRTFGCINSTPNIATSSSIISTRDFPSVKLPIPRQNGNSSPFESNFLRHSKITSRRNAKHFPGYPIWHTQRYSPTCKLIGVTPWKTIPLDGSYYVQRGRGYDRWNIFCNFVSWSLVAYFMGIIYRFYGISGKGEVIEIPFLLR